MLSAPGQFPIPQGTIDIKLKAWNLDADTAVFVIDQNSATLRRQRFATLNDIGHIQHPELQGKAEQVFVAGYCAPDSRLTTTWLECKGISEIKARQIIDSLHPQKRTVFSYYLESYRDILRRAPVGSTDETKAKYLVSHDVSTRCFNAPSTAYYTTDRIQRSLSEVDTNLVYWSDDRFSTELSSKSVHDPRQH